MLTGGEDRRLVLGQNSPDSHAAAQPLGQRHYIRFDPVLLVGEEAARAADSRLNFVQDEQYALLVTPGAHLGQVAIVREVDPTLALHRLYHDGAGALGGGRLDGADAVIFDVDEAVGEGREGLLHFFLSGSRHHSQGAAVKGAQGGDNLVGAVQF